MGLSTIDPKRADIARVRRLHGQTWELRILRLTGEELGRWEFETRGRFRGRIRKSVQRQLVSLGVHTRGKSSWEKIEETWIAALYPSHERDGW